MDVTEPWHVHGPKLQHSLDFVNSRRLQRGVLVDAFPDLTSALYWLRARDLLHLDAMQATCDAAAAQPERADKMLRRIRELRAAMRELVDFTVQRRAPAARQLAVVNRALRTPLINQLTLSPDGVSLDHRHEGDPVEGAMARLAETLARVLTSDASGRLRVCIDKDCQFAFYDTSRTGRRKWCDMATCGNRAKAAGHRLRVRDVLIAAVGTVPAKAPDAGPLEPDRLGARDRADPLTE